MKNKIVGSMAILLLTMGSLGRGTIYAATVTVNVQIAAGTVSITSPASLTFANPIAASFNSQAVAEEFTGTTNYFTVIDLKGADNGYNTTLQISGNLVAGSNSIASGNVSFKSSSGTVLTISGSANPLVLIDSNATSYQTLNIARTFIYRSTAANSGVIGQYAQNIFLQITVPASQPAGSYAGTLVYTLIEN